MAHWFNDWTPKQDAGQESGGVCDACEEVAPAARTSLEETATCARRRVPQTQATDKQVSHTKPHTN